jgi:hypothetical protein
MLKFRLQRDGRAVIIGGKLAKWTPLEDSREREANETVVVDAKTFESGQKGW